MKQKYVLHEFTMGDCDDVEIYVAEPIYKWQQTPEGKWAMEHAEDMYWTSDPNDYFGHNIQIIGTLSEKYSTFYALKTAK
ncbi:MAG: hypothetical protein VW551_07175 [Euryarchaeota archaeon]|jgi:hypothetical protein